MGNAEPEAEAFLANRQRPYDIYARVFRFAVGIIRFVRTFGRSVEAQELGRQLIRTGTGSECASPRKSAIRSRAKLSRENCAEILRMLSSIIK